MSVRRPTEEELKFINRRFIKSEQKLGQDELWVMDVEAAKSGVKTAYFSYLSKRSIENFARNVNAKAHNRSAKTVGYYLNHDTVSRLPMGALFDGKTVEQGDDLAFQHKVFLPAGFSTGDVTTDDYVQSVRFSMSEDVSVGFIGNKFICDICQNDIRSTKCSHWPGVRYNVGTEDEPEYKVCTYTVDDAKLVEVSAAWKGALPGARVLSDADPDEGILPKNFNIKQFADGSYLKFTYSADGGIEQLDELSATKLLSDDNDGGMILMKKEFEINDDLTKELEAVVALVGDEGLSEQSPEDAAVPEAMTENTEEFTEPQETSQLTVLQARAAELEEAYAELQEQNEHLTAKVDELSSLSQKFIDELDTEIHKLSVGVDAETYSKEAVDMVISKMDVDEKIKYRNNLRIKLAKALRTGRSTTVEEEKPSATLENSIDPKVYRVGRK